MSKRLRHISICSLGALLLCGSGGCLHSRAANGLPLDEAQIENPMFVPVVDSNFLWEQLSDELDNYFKIRREERVRVIGNKLTQGWIETFPTSGSTILEPWRKDSTHGFEKWQSTLQTIRRWARIRVIPSTGGFLVEVNVFKELEDLDQPQNSAVAGEVRRYDNSLRRPEKDTLVDTGSYGWIPLGRDFSLEQKILANVNGRLTDILPSGQRLPINGGAVPILPTQ